MLSKYNYIGFLLFIFSYTAFSQSLKNLENINFGEAEFYLLDVTDNNAKVVPSIDAYRHQEELYIALGPLFEGLRLKYSLIGSKLSVTFAEKTTEFDLDIEKDNKGDWFNDGSFIFIKASIIEQLFSTQIKINTNTLKMDLSGHKHDFPYKTIEKQRKQRKYNNYVFDDIDVETPKKSGGVITIEDKYRLATVPTGYANFEYQSSKRDDNYSAVIQTESDLLYHSASITLVSDNDETNSRVLLSRYPQYTGDKILGIWDQYSVGDLWLRQSPSNPEGSSRGLGINFSANYNNNVSENMTTSFAKTARPGWEADVFHNGVFLETRVIPSDGLLEFNNLELFYGENEFKIVTFGPHGEKEILYERVSVKSNSLAQGNMSYGLSLKENDSSLLDLDLPEFDIDAIGGHFNIGLLDNWQLGVSVDFNDIHNSNGGTESYRLSNQVTLPGWFFQNNTSFNSNSIDQTTSLATSFLNNDNLTLKYRSTWDRSDTESAQDITTLEANYNIRLGSTTNNFSYSYDDLEGLKSERLNYRFNIFYNYFNISNTLSYLKRSGNEEQILGSLNINSRIYEDFRFVASIPYDINGEETVNPDNISASFLYNYRTADYNHSFNVSNSSFFKENLWSVGYNLAINKPTHQFTLRTQYNSTDNWSLKAGIIVNFGYDSFNNKVVFSNGTTRGGGYLDTHAYIDRRLNGVPDVLDYDLAGVTFSGGSNWENVETNEEGRARLFGARRGITALSAKWKTGSTTLNNDYLIYSHPGSLQRVNLPFYLTTELELFVVLGNDNQSVTLANVPLKASNKSTGDEYTLETDFDGYASFVDLMPGKYHVYVDKKYLQEKGLKADVGGFEFNSPLKGGFVVLPNIELARSESGDIGDNKLQNVLLDENNYAPLLDTENDKLIHLPPKGRMKAPYSSDLLHLAKFKEVKMQSTGQERRELRDKLEVAAAGDSQSFSSQLSLGNRLNGTSFNNILVTPLSSDSLSNDQGTQSVLDEIPNEEALNNSPAVVEDEVTPLNLLSSFVVQYGVFNNVNSAKALAQNFAGIGQFNIVRKNVNGKLMFGVISQTFQNIELARKHLELVNKGGFIVKFTDDFKYLDPLVSPEPLEGLNKKIKTKESKIEVKLDLSSGYIVQYAAFNNLSSAIALAQSLSSIEQLHIAEKVVRGNTMYCLVSKVFKEKFNAIEYIELSNKDGYIYDAVQYSDVVWSKI